MQLVSTLAHEKCLWPYLQVGTKIPCGYLQPLRRLERLTDWLEQCGVTTVALGSTGVYWIPLFEILEQRGIRPCLVNARHMKNVPGRRTDWHECQFQQPRLSSRAFGPRKLMKSHSERVCNRLREDGELTFDPVYDNWSEALRISIVNAP
jgi:transposase